MTAIQQIKYDMQSWCLYQLNVQVTFSMGSSRVHVTSLHVDDENCASLSVASLSLAGGAK